LNITKTTPNALIANVTSDSYDFVPFLVPIITTLIGAFITIVVFYFQRKQQRVSAEYQEKQLNLSAMMEVFKILNNDEHRQARENVYSACKQFDQGQKEIFQNENIRKNAAMVRADFDEIGLLIQNGLVPKDMFLSAYWNTVIISWKALKDDIAKERLRRKYSMYMAFFEQLYQEAEDYAKENGMDTKTWKSNALL
jgi:cellulose synthase/poly-beta-1,6-N-acetylglucosamine synthase-like glycosyltransferase